MTEEAQPAAEVEAEEEHEPRTYVKYIGTADIREITVADLRKAGLEEAEEGLRWDRSNRFRIPKEDVLEVIGEESYLAIIDQDAGLVEVEE